MKNLNQKELEEINGGGIWGELLAIAIVIYDALNSDGTPQL